MWRHWWVAIWTHGTYRYFRYSINCKTAGVHKHPVPFSCIKLESTNEDNLRSQCTVMCWFRKGVAFNLNMVLDFFLGVLFILKSLVAFLSIWIHFTRTGGLFCKIIMKNTRIQALAWSWPSSRILFTVLCFVYLLALYLPVVHC